MPINEYKCQRCGDKFEYSKGLFERENNIKCPKCGAQNPKKVVAPVNPDSYTKPFAPRGGG